MSDIATWGTKDWLEAATYAIGILVALLGAIFWLSKVRSESIATMRQHIQRTWTNEGDVTSQEFRFIDLSLAESDGDLVGTLSSSSLDRTLEVHIDIGWRSSLLKISELSGRHMISVAEARVSLTGNNNRLEWKIVSRKPPAFLPERATLWPMPSSTGE